MQFVLLLALAEIAGDKAALAVDALQNGVQVPVFLGMEVADLVFAVHHDAGGHALHTAGAQLGTPQLVPEHGRELIAHQAVQHAPGLLCVHQVHVDVPG